MLRRARWRRNTGASWCHALTYYIQLKDVIYLHPSYKKKPGLHHTRGLAVGSRIPVLGYNMAHHSRNTTISQFLHRLLLIVLLYTLSQSVDNSLRYTEPT